MTSLCGRVFCVRSGVTFIIIVVILLFSALFALLSLTSVARMGRYKLIQSPFSVANSRRSANDLFDDSHFFIFPDESAIVRAYLDVVRDTVCGLTLRTQERAVHGTVRDVRPFDIGQRIKGLDWPLIGITMVGQKRLVNIEWALRLVIATEVPGDFIECGVWRGGSSVFARAILKALNINDRHVWLADSFQGLPKARTKNDNDEWSKQEYLKVSFIQRILPDRMNFTDDLFLDISESELEFLRRVTACVSGKAYEF